VVADAPRLITAAELDHTVGLRLAGGTTSTGRSTSSGRSSTSFYPTIVTASAKYRDRPHLLFAGVDGKQAANELARAIIIASTAGHFGKALATAPPRRWRSGKV
jgi:hypothetical protein